MAPAFSWYLAVRYLLARWVNVLGVAGVAVAVWALIVVISVFSGFIFEIRDHIRGATADLVVTNLPEQTSFDELRPGLESDLDVVATAPRLQHYGIVFPHDDTFGPIRRRLRMTAPTGSSPLQNNAVVLIGLDPEREAATSEFAEWLALPADPDGEPSRFAVLDPQRPLTVSGEQHKRALFRAGLEVPKTQMLRTMPGLLLSHRRMTRGDRTFPGQLVDLLSVRFWRRGNADEKVNILRRQFVVTGAFETKYRSFDDLHAFVHIDTLRDMLGYDQDMIDALDVVTEIAVRTRPGADLLAVQQRLTQALGGVGVVRTWEEQNQLFLDAVDHERAMMKVVLFAVMLVAGFLIYATLHMMVTQKVKDIGILTSLGATPHGIAALFSICAVVIALIGCTTGAITGLLSAHYLNDVNDWAFANFQVELFPTQLYDLDRIPYRIEADWVAQVLVAAFALSLVVAYFPARRAARMDPVRALSYE